METCETCQFFRERLVSAKTRTGTVAEPEAYGRCEFVLAKQPLAKWMTGFGWESHTRDLFDASLPSGARLIPRSHSNFATTCEAHLPKGPSDE